MSKSSRKSRKERLTDKVKQDECMDEYSDRS